MIRYCQVQEDSCRFMQVQAYFSRIIQSFLTKNFQQILNLYINYCCGSLRKMSENRDDNILKAAGDDRLRRRSYCLRTFGYKIENGN